MKAVRALCCDEMDGGELVLYQCSSSGILISDKYIWSIALYDAENWTHRKMDQKCVGRFQM